MPTKGARLAQRNRKGRKPVYVIKDTGVELSTGTGDREQAEIALAQYIASKGRTGGPSDASEITISEILEIYGREHAPTVAAPERQGYAISALVPFWGDLPASSIKGETCRRYAAHRAKAPATIRRELNTLQAALNYCRKEGYLIAAPVVTMPRTPETTQQAMTREEVAKLLRSARARRYHHIAHFILISIYTGTRKAAALNLKLYGPATHGGWFDLESGLLFRRGRGEKVTNKRRTPSRVPRQLLAHANRWQAMGQTWAIEYQGNRVLDIKSAWKTIVKDAKLGWRAGSPARQTTPKAWQQNPL